MRPTVEVEVREEDVEVKKIERRKVVRIKQ